MLLVLCSVERVWRLYHKYRTSYLLCNLKAFKVSVISAEKSVFENLENKSNSLKIRVS